MNYIVDGKNFSHKRLQNSSFEELEDREGHHTSQIGKFAECAGDLSYVQIVCAAAFVSLNNSSIVSFCCFTKISWLEPRLKFKVRGREIGRARQTFQSGIQGAEPGNLGFQFGHVCEEEKADCYILQDVDISVDALSNTAMCKSCRSWKSRLQRLRKNSEMDWPSFSY